VNLRVREISPAASCHCEVVSMARSEAELTGGERLTHSLVEPYTVLYCIILLS
jgi:hypothetical protein